MAPTASDLRTTVPDVRSAGQRGVVCDAVVACVARWGLSKTTIDDIARQADLSRATLYRLFPGGRQEIIDAAGRREVDAILGGVAAAMVGGPDVEAMIRSGLRHGSLAISSHPAIGHLLENEPEAILPYFSFDGLGVVLDLASEHLAPVLARVVDPTTAGDLAEWLTRLVVSYTVFPLGLDLSADEDRERLLLAHVLPALARWAEPQPVHPQPSPNASQQEASV
jgi:AcrR family transcriptional regulator